MSTGIAENETGMDDVMYNYIQYIWYNVMSPNTRALDVLLS